METVGIICEYNPLHLGHQKQLQTLHAKDRGIVCLMSGNYVQRGKPAIFDKSLRAEAAIRCGADLVLELPITAALSSAEGFAAGGVSILGGFCDYLCFGAEDPKAPLDQLSQALLSDEFRNTLRHQLNKGLSFPAARQAALTTMGLDAAILSKPNNILAVEYCKAILSLGSSMKPMPILRNGNYHDKSADLENPSATAIRELMSAGQDWLAYVPDPARPIFTEAPPHSLAAGERAVLARLRTMVDEEFEALPFSSEGLWRKLMHVSRQQATLEGIASAVKSKRYTRSRIDRMLMCAFLGLTQRDLETPAPYCRVLAFNERGREILKIARKTGHFPNVGELQNHPYQAIEKRCDDLYGLFATGNPEPPGADHARRVRFVR